MADSEFSNQVKPRLSNILETKAFVLGSSLVFSESPSRSLPLKKNTLAPYPPEDPIVTVA